jgi:hypothetical protein
MTDRWQGDAPRGGTVLTRNGTHAPGGIARFTGGLALAVSVFAAAALLLGATTPVRSGRNCTGPCLVPPYEGAAAFVPRDYLWMYPAILTAVGAAALILCLWRDTTVGAQGGGRSPP